MSRTNEPYQNFLTAVCFPGSLCSYLMWTRPHLRKKQVLPIIFVQCWSCDDSIRFKYFFHTIQYFSPMLQSSCMQNWRCWTFSAQLCVIFCTTHKVQHSF